MKTILLCATACVALAGGARADEASFSDRPIHYIVASPPGGIADTTARVLGPHLAEALHTSVVIENRTGGGIIAGSEAVARSTPDGHTLLSATPLIAIAPSMPGERSYDFHRDLAPVALIGWVPNVLMVGPRTPARTITELVDLARRNPGKLNYSSTGVGTSVQLAAELLNYYAKVQIVHIPYHGAAAAMTALMAGNVDMMVDALPPSMAQIRAGKVRALAVTSAKRVPQLPDVPTMIESGYPDIEVTGWSGVMTRAGTPAAVIAQLGATIEHIVASPEVAAAYNKIGLNIRYLPAAEFGTFLETETRRFALAIQHSDMPKN